MSDSKGSPVSSPIVDILDQLHRTYAPLHQGEVADYIPELAKANPAWFGIAVATAGGFVYEVGDSRQEFTIQSISKPFVYGLALEDHGRAEVLQKVSVEPTGDAFNSISLEPETGRPRNPMINAGAIACTSLIQGKSDRTRLDRLLQTFSLYAGRDLAIDEAVYRSESETGHRNRAIGHMLRNFNILSEDPTPALELYFKQCSISVTCRDLALMAATLANRGVNPVTGRQAVRGEYVESILSVMASCGMYDYAGEWIYKVGMPAKSGVSGGIIAILPGRLGVAVLSPPLDAAGNSVRGIRVCDDLSRHFDLHLFNTTNPGKSVVRTKYTGADMNSSRVRTADERERLRAAASRIQVYQLQGELTFATAEVVVREIIEEVGTTEFVILDLKRVLGMNECSVRLLHRTLEKLAALNKPLIFTHTERAPLLRRYMKLKLGERFEELFRTFEDSELALEWCENLLLEWELGERFADRTAAHAEYELFAGLSPDELTVIGNLLERRTYALGDIIIQAGEEARELFFLARGHVSVIVPTASGREKRLATFSAGMAFGEMAILDHAPRSAVVQADTDIECDLLQVAEFDRLADTHPRIRMTLLQNLSLGLCRKLRKANREMSVFD